MKVKHKIAIATLLFACLWSIVTTPAATAVQQWFPSTGTKIEYTLTNSIRWKNNSIQVSDRFNVYNSSGIYVIVPSKLVAVAPQVPFSLPLLYHDVAITCIHEYFEKSSTELNRTFHITMGNVTSPIIGMFEIFDFVQSWNNVTYQYNQFANQNIIVGKTAFMSDINLDFFDYIDNSAMAGQKITTYWGIVTVTTDRIVAVNSYNATIVAGTDGKVLSYTLASGGLSFAGQPNMAGVSFTFEVIQSNSIFSGIFDSPVEWVILAGVGVALLIVGVLIGYSRRKS
jgi:hypothetical protein